MDNHASTPTKKINITTKDSLFAYIEEHQLHERDGWKAKRVLDAGSGEHSLSWLLHLSEAQGIAELVAITGEKARAQTLKDQILAFRENIHPSPSECTTSMQVFHGNWQDPSFLQHEVHSFDIILAGRRKVILVLRPYATCKEILPSHRLISLVRILDVFLLFSRTWRR